MRRFFILLSFVLCCGVSAFAQTPQTKTLPNGLTILVQENHAAPVVAVRFYVTTGSIYEGQYLGSGISHLFEHLLQEGSKTRTKEQINAEAQAIGGQTNAYTSNDLTAYHITTAAPYFERALDNLADSMMNATFPEAEVKTQQGIIHHEMNMGDDDPSRVLWEAFSQTAFIRHPVRFPVLGFKESFDRITREDIVNYYRTHYTPENTILAVAGDVKASDVFASAQKVLGNWPRSSANTPAIPDEPIQSTPRRVVIEKPIQNVSAMMGWHTIPLQHPDLYALDVLARVLGGGETSRLVQELREKRELVYEISAFSSTPNYNAGIFGIQANLAVDKISEFEKAVWAQINNIKIGGVSTPELARAKRGMETDFTFNNDVATQAERMAYDFLGTGDANYSARYIQNINAVTASQVQSMAKKYLLENGVTTAIVRPESKPSTPVVAAAKASAAKTQTIKPAQMFALKNGLRVIIRENKTTPTVAISAVGLGGTRLENANKPGVAHLAVNVLQKGTAKRSAEKFAEIVDDLGANLEFASGYNSWTLASNWLARDWRRGLSLVHEALTQPTFPEAEVRREKAAILAEIQQQQDDPAMVSSLLLRGAFFGKSHPYGRSPLGTLESVAKITRADVVENWKETFNPRDTIIAIYGDVNESEARRVAEYLFGDLSAAPSSASNGNLKARTEIPVLTQQIVVQQSKPDITQTVISVGYPGIKVQDADRYALTVLDGALSGIYYPGGRLHARLRDNQLVYGVHAFQMPGIEGGSFMVEAGTTQDKRDEVRKIIEEEIQKIRDAPISEAELERAKGMAITSRAVDLQTNSAQASAAISDELFGLGFRNGAQYLSAINAISAQEVQRVAQKYLRPEASAIAIVEPQTQVTNKPEEKLGETQITPSILEAKPISTEAVSSGAGVLWPCRKLPAFSPENWDEVESAFADYDACQLTQHWRKTLQNAFEPARARIGWREDTLWVLADLTDKDIFNPATLPNEETYKMGDTFEIFLRDKSVEPYLELHVSPFNQRLQLKLPFPRGIGRDREWSISFVDEPIFQSWTQVSREKNHWRVLAAIPARSLMGNESIKIGDQWQCSFGRYDYTTGEKRPVISSTSAHLKADFHRQHEWRTLVFC